VLDTEHVTLQNVLAKSHKTLHTFSGINLEGHTQKGFVNGKGQWNIDFKNETVQAESRTFQATSLDFHQPMEDSLFIFS